MYIGETAWTEPLFGRSPPTVDVNDINCSGGGFSTLFSRPDFQRGVVNRGNGRGAPDVSYDTE